jgi:hypothetical protein
MAAAVDLKTAGGSGVEDGRGRGPEGRPGHEACHPEDSEPWRPERGTTLFAAGGRSEMGQWA